MRKYLLFILLLFVTTTHAAIEAYEFETVEMEADYTKLINELRCLVCQNQNLAASNADLAKDIRGQIYKMLTQGDSADQVIDYMVARYSEFVLYRPRLKGSTILLWIGPFVLLALVLVLVVRRMNRTQTLIPPDEESMKRAKFFLSNTEDKT